MYKNQLGLIAVMTLIISTPNQADDDAKETNPTLLESTVKEYNNFVMPKINNLLAPLMPKNSKYKVEWSENQQANIIVEKNNIKPEPIKPTINKRVDEQGRVYYSDGLKHKKEH